MGMFDLCHVPNKMEKSMTAQQIFDDLEKTEIELLKQPNDINKCSPAKNVSNEKRLNLSTSFKRYRRKSLAPQFDQMDNLDDEEEENEIEQEEEKKEDSERVTVCDYHR